MQNKTLFLLTYVLSLLFLVPSSAFAIDQSFHSALGYTYFGENEDGHAGEVIASGDTNGDGYQDLLIGAHGDYNGRGGVYIVYGHNQYHPDEDMRYADMFFSGVYEGDHAGQTVASGDINGDGYDDIITYAAGTIYIIYGGETNYHGAISLYSYRQFTTDGPVTEIDSGDINGDGYDDIIIGAANDENNAGAAYVVYGQEEAYNFSPLSDNASIFTGTSSSQLGSDIGLGDINGDGYSDVMIGAQKYNSTGSVYLLYGSQHRFSGDESITTAADATFLPTEWQSDFGLAISAGDLNGDSYDELIFGHSNYREQGNVQIFGSVDVFFGDAQRYSGTVSVAQSDVQLVGEEPYDYAGSYVTTGDENADGYDDIYIGARGHGEGGAVYVFYGQEVPFNSSILSLSEADWKYYSEDSGSKIGNMISIFDADGRGYDDMVFGVPDDDWNQVDAGAVYILYSKRTDMDTDNIDASEDCNDFDPSIGYPLVEMYADSDGDGYGDSEAVSHFCTEEEAALTGLVADNTDVNDSQYDADNDGIAPENDCNDNDAQVGGPDVQMYADSDGDGYGNGDELQLFCSVQEGNSAGYVVVEYLCVDYPGYENYCRYSYDLDDSVYDRDNDDIPPAVDCNDNNPTIGEADIEMYVDADADGYVNIHAPSKSFCTAEEGYAEGYALMQLQCAEDPDVDVTCDILNLDANDQDHDNDGVSMHDECNDNNATETHSANIPMYQDNDNDGYGARNTAKMFCSYEEGYAAGYVDSNDDVNDDQYDTNNDGISDYSETKTDSDTRENTDTGTEEGGENNVEQSDQQVTQEPTSIQDMNATNKGISVIYEDGTTQEKVFFPRSKKKTILKVLQKKELVLALQANGTKLVLADYSGEIIAKTTLSRKKFNVNAIKVKKVRKKQVAVITSSAKRKKSLLHVIEFHKNGFGIQRKKKIQSRVYAKKTRVKKKQIIVYARKQTFRYTANKKLVTQLKKVSHTSK